MRAQRVSPSPPLTAWPLHKGGAEMRAGRPERIGTPAASRVLTEERASMADKRDMVLSVFRDHAHAQRAYEWLTSRGYGNNDVNVMMSDETRTRYYTPAERAQGKDKVQAGTLGTEGMGVGGAIGTVVGATIGAVAAIGTNLVLPGLGLVIAGPIAAALAGAGAGAATGGIVGGLIGLGIPEGDARAYENALKTGGVVVGVHPRKDDSGAIKDYFSKNGGENVYAC